MSKVAYSAAVFLQVVRNEKVTVDILAVKSRVPNIQRINIPRLECFHWGQAVCNCQEKLEERS